MCALAQAAPSPRAQQLLLPDTNHVLTQVTSNVRTANLASYSATNVPLAAGVASAIADFVRRGGDAGRR